MSIASFNPELWERLKVVSFLTKTRKDFKLSKKIRVFLEKPKEETSVKDFMDLFDETFNSLMDSSERQMN